MLALVLLGVAHAVDAADRGDDDDVAAGEQAGRGRVAQPVDLVVDRRVLLDVRVARRDVRLGLVVVVVADEVLDPVVGEELAHLLGQLGGEGLVGGEDQRRPLDLLDRPGDGRALARAGDAEQRLEAVAAQDAGAEALDRLRLIAGGAEVGDDAERLLLHGASLAQRTLVRLRRDPISSSPPAGDEQRRPPAAGRRARCRSTAGSPPVVPSAPERRPADADRVGAADVVTRARRARCAARRASAADRTAGSPGCTGPG